MCMHASSHLAPPSLPLQVDIKEQPAIDALQQLLQNCEEPGSFDFVFIGRCCVIALIDLSCQCKH